MSGRRTRIRRIDRAVLTGLGLGVALILQPVWEDGFRLGFFATLLFTLLHIVTSHLVAGDE